MYKSLYFNNKTHEPLAIFRLSNAEWKPKTLAECVSPNILSGGTWITEYCVYSIDVLSLGNSIKSIYQTDRPAFTYICYCFFFFHIELINNKYSYICDHILQLCWAYSTFWTEKLAKREHFLQIDIFYKEYFRVWHFRIR